MTDPYTDLPHTYVIALGSNQRHHRFGAPRAIVAAAIAALDSAPLALVAQGPLISSAPVGPSQRRYANSCVLVQTPLPPPALLAHLQAIEARFGRRRQGQRWRARTLDLDIVLWSGGVWAEPALVIPHREFRRRRFVLDPACAIATAWRDPVSGLLLVHLAARVKKHCRSDQFR